MRLQRLHKIAPHRLRGAVAKHVQHVWQHQRVSLGEVDLGHRAHLRFTQLGTPQHLCRGQFDAGFHIGQQLGHQITEVRIVQCGPPRAQSAQCRHADVVVLRWIIRQPRQRRVQRTYTTGAQKLNCPQANRRAAVEQQPFQAACPRGWKFLRRASLGGIKQKQLAGRVQRSIAKRRAKRSSHSRVIAKRREGILQGGSFRFREPISAKTAHQGCGKRSTPSRMPRGHPDRGTPHSRIFIAQQWQQLANV